MKSSKAGKKQHKQKRDIWQKGRKGSTRDRIKTISKRKKEKRMLGNAI